MWVVLVDLIPGESSIVGFQLRVVAFSDNW